MNVFDSTQSLAHQPQTGTITNGKRSVSNYSPDEALQINHNSVAYLDPQRVTLLKRLNQPWSRTTAINITNDEYDSIKNDVSLIKSYKQEIMGHVASRTALFFQQCLLCYKTPYRYTIAKTEGQIFSAKTLKVKTAGQAVISQKYNAAHQSTIPGLNACLRSEYKAHKEDSTKPEPVYKLVLKDTYSENLHNSTSGVPVFVNNLDSLIDGKANQPLLRSDTIKLINRVAKGKLTPTEATREFLNYLQKHVETRSAAQTGGKAKVAKYFLKQIQDMVTQASVSTQVAGVHSFFDYLLGINLSKENTDDMPKIRTILAQRKYEIVREAQYTEAKIAEIIARFFPAQTSHNAKQNVRLHLVHQVKDTWLETPLQKLFSISTAALEAKPSLVARLDAFYSTRKIATRNALGQISAAIKKFQIMEQCSRALLLADFRNNLRHLTQREVSAKLDVVVANRLRLERRKPVKSRNVNRIYLLQSFPSSQSRMSRLENARIHLEGHHVTPANQRRAALRKIDIDLLCEALKVQPEHFMNSFFASKE